MSTTPQQPDDPRFDDLRRLLALKRHETPPKETMDGFLSEFHRRQEEDRAAEIARQANRWSLRLREWLGIPPSVPGDEAFPALRRLLALKRYEAPPAVYFENFLARLRWRMAAQHEQPATFWARWREALTVRPAVVAQLAVATTVVVLLAGLAVDRWTRQLTAKSEFGPMTVVSAPASHEEPVRVVYVDAATEPRQEEPVETPVMKLPFPEARPGVHFVSDSVDFSPRQYATLVHY
ncbi:MAG: hypothetical protein FJ388_05755 [Verrucomicrobia bacterium]|nr:hypothetical protein [Verrucomicrobiota bacterium]